MLTALAAVFPLLVALAVISGAAYVLTCVGRRALDVLFPTPDYLAPWREEDQ